VANTQVTGIKTVAQGGTGASTLTANSVVLGNGTSAVQFVAPGTTGNVLTSNGTNWTSAAASGSGFTYQIFSANGTFTIPTGVTRVQVWVQGGGGAGGYVSGAMAGGGGAGGLGFSYLSNLTPGNTIAVTINSGGVGSANTTGNTGGSASISSGTQTITTITANGGAGGVGSVGSGGAGGTVSGADILRKGSAGTGADGCSGQASGSGGVVIFYAGQVMSGAGLALNQTQQAGPDVLVSFPTTTFNGTTNTSDLWAGNSVLTGIGQDATAYGCGGSGGKATRGGSGKTGYVLFTWNA
jgi:hypothetical protein